MNFKWVGMSEDGAKVELHRFEKFNLPMVEFTNVERAGGLRKVVLLDVETTGLHWQREEIIEIAARVAFYEQSSGRLKCISSECFEQLNQPRAPISTRVSRLTGITDEMVHGRSIDWQQFSSFIAGADLLISHHAAFDRPFIDKYAKYSPTPWGCSINNIDWQSRGFDSSKLGVLAIYHGFFGRAHRALDDVNVLTHLLSFEDSEHKKMYFSELLTDVFIPRQVVTIFGTTYEIRDSMRQFGYKWMPQSRAWVKVIKKISVDRELDTIKKLSTNHTFNFKIDDFNISDGYKSIHNFFSQIS